MSLTTKDILEKTFKRSFKGYDEDEVDKFLDEIIDEIKALRNENEALKKEIGSVKELEKNIKDTEDTIMNTLVSAQKSSERMLREAARKAELLIDNAENTAKQKVEQTSKDLAESEKKLAVIKQSAANFALSFTEMIGAQSTAFEKTYQSYFGDMDVYSAGGINAEALEKIDKSISEDIGEIVGGQTDTEENATEALQLSIEEEQQADTAEEPQLVMEEPLEVEWNLPIEAQAAPGATAAAAPEAAEPVEEAPAAAEESVEEEAPAQEQEPVSEIVKNEPEVPLEPLTPEKGEIDSMPLNEINEKLTQIEEAGDDVPDSVKNKYEDYSWLYGDDKKEGSSEYELSFKDPEEGKQLKDLIDDVIE